MAVRKSLISLFKVSKSGFVLGAKAQTNAEIPNAVTPAIDAAIAATRLYRFHM